MLYVRKEESNKVEVACNTMLKDMAVLEASYELAAMTNLVFKSEPADGPMLKSILAAGIRGVEELVNGNISELYDVDQERLDNLKKLNKRLCAGKYCVLRNDNAS